MPASSTAQQYTQQWQGQTWDAAAAGAGVGARRRPTCSRRHPSRRPPRQGVLAGSAVAAAAGPGAGPRARTGPRTGPCRRGSTGATYGPATLAGNPRITDAQRARAGGPFADHRAGHAARRAHRRCWACSCSGTAAVGSYALLVPLVAAPGGHRGGLVPAERHVAGPAGHRAGVPGRRWSRTPCCSPPAGRTRPAAILGTLGVWVLLTLVLQLRSTPDPTSGCTA